MGRKPTIIELAIRCAMLAEGDLEPLRLPNNPKQLYWRLRYKVHRLKYVYRVGPVPGNDGWEFGAGGTFFSFNEATALQYGNRLDIYRIKRPIEPLFCLSLETLGRDGEVTLDYRCGLDETGLIEVDDEIELGRKALADGYDGVVDATMDDPEQIWMVNDEIDDILELIKH